MTFSLATVDEIQRHLGQRLRAQRLAQALPQRELAAMAGLSLGALRQLEDNGRVSLDTLLRVAGALGLNSELDALFAPVPQSIATMERAALAARRQRAPRRPRS